MFTLKEFLKEEVKPALGCTEPVAVALAAARANKEIDNLDELESLKISVSNNIYKNGMDVGIPGTNGAKGNAIAAGLGLICGNADNGLEVLKDCREEDLINAEQLLKDNKIIISCHPEKTGVYVHAVINTKNESAEAKIQNDHSNITMVSKNDKITYQQNKTLDSIHKKSPVVEQIGVLNYDQILKLVEEIDEEDIAYIIEGIKLNLEIAEYGLKEGSVSGASFGKTFKKFIEKNNIDFDLGHLIKIYNYAAADARMAGASMPVMSSAGSGNHGITAILPIAIVGREEKKSEEEIAKSITISHLTTSYVKSKIGRLSPVCGCAVAAGAGAAAGLTALLGGSTEQIKLSIKNILANVSGMICDGAKPSCALKVGTASYEAYLAALFALENKGITSTQGIINDSIEKTVNNVGLINGMGMKDMDSVIIDIMESREETKNESKKKKKRTKIS